MSIASRVVAPRPLFLFICAVLASALFPISVIFFKKYYFNTTDQVDCIPVTHEVHYCIRDAAAETGLALVVVPGPAAALTIGESIPEVIDALKNACAGWSSETTGATAKDARKIETDIRPRVLSALLGRTLQIPFEAGRLCLDPYSDVLLCDFEPKGQRREVLMTVFGEAPQEQQQGPPMMEEEMY